MIDALVSAGVEGDAADVAALLCVDPVGTGGVALRECAGPSRDAWLRLVGELMPAGAPLRRVPLHIRDDRLLGGLDLAATLAAGRPVAQRGLLAESDGGIVVLAMAERISAGTAARIAAVLDAQEVVMERDGIAARRPARIGVIAFDEGTADDERLPAKLLERLAFHLQPAMPAHRFEQPAAPAWTRSDVSAARSLLPFVEVGDALRHALCAAAGALGIDSIRAPLLALRVARAAAALGGRLEVDAADAALAARLVLAARATTVPAQPLQPEDDAAPDEASKAQPRETEPPPGASADADEPRPGDNAGIEDTVLEAALAAVPAGLLDALKACPGGHGQSQSVGRSGAPLTGSLRGRPGGVRRGEPHAGARLNLIETLRAAAPWQALRRQDRNAAAASARIQVRREDFHVSRFKHRSETTTLFVVDASGSSALHRLAEAKGAVELLLADCYVRRDRVSLIAFRGRGAELLLPPTRSLVRAKRSLAALPGGGGTPLAAGIDAALALAEATRRGGRTPVAVLLTDGCANIARDGTAGRQRAGEDALQSARKIRAAGITALLLDTSPQPQGAARQLAGEMGATYLPLPHADAALLSRAVRAAGEAGAASR